MKEIIAIILTLAGIWLAVLMIMTAMWCMIKKHRGEAKCKRVVFRKEMTFEERLDLVLSEGKIIEKNGRITDEYLEISGEHKCISACSENDFYEADACIIDYFEYEKRESPYESLRKDLREMKNLTKALDDTLTKNIEKRRRVKALERKKAQIMDKFRAINLRINLEIKRTKDE